MKLRKSQRECPGCHGIVSAPAGSHTATVEATLARHMKCCPAIPAPVARPGTVGDALADLLGKGRAPTRRTPR